MRHCGGCGSGLRTGVSIKHVNLYQISLCFNFQKENPENCGKRYPDFLDILLLARDEDGSGLTDGEIRDEVGTFLFAGNLKSTIIFRPILHIINYLYNITNIIEPKYKCVVFCFPRLGE